jgi:ATP-dependent RNA helicase RhlE
MTTINNATTSKETISFKNLGISSQILDMLNKHNFFVPTPIQHKVIPTGIEGKDIIGIAQTGTGKTLGFGIPMIQRLLLTKNKGLVILPTRELALQVDEMIRKIGQPLGIKTCVLIGGESMYRQIQGLRHDPNIIIATPGRLIDHLKRRSVRLDRVSILVLDEADHMFDIGFAPQIREIMKSVPKERQTLLFSATMPEPIARLAMEHMALPLRIEVAPSGTVAEKVEQEIIVVNKSSKFSLLVKLLSESTGPILIFTRTKHGAKHIAYDLRNTGITATEIHSNRSLSQRREALDGFKKHKYRVMVATDIAARGIDVKDIEFVINYDLPEQTEDYVHRIGRTGRAGKSGKAISFATPDQKRDIVSIERLIKRSIPMKSHQGAVMSAFSYPKPRPYGSHEGLRKNFSRNRRPPYNDNRNRFARPSNKMPSGNQHKRVSQGRFRNAK